MQVGSQGFTLIQLQKEQVVIYRGIVIGLGTLFGRISAGIVVNGNEKSGVKQDD